MKLTKKEILENKKVLKEAIRNGSILKGDKIDVISFSSKVKDQLLFPNEINFPMVINGDKYPVLETVIKKGTPYVQILPFKRDSWKMDFKPRKQKDILNSRLFYGLKLLNIYKEKYWNKKSWK